MSMEINANFSHYKTNYTEPEMKAMPSEGAPEKSAEKCTTNTDKVDREIQKLKEEKKQLEQQIKAAGDEEQVKALEKRLAQVESALKQKDNDGYRRQNAVVDYKI